MSWMYDLSQRRILSLLQMAIGMVCLGWIISLSGCYSFKSTSIPPEMETYFVAVFENRADNVVPNLAIDFTELLRSKIRKETRLRYTERDPHVTFSGYISRYEVIPYAAQNEAAANLSDLEIAVRVVYEAEFGEKKEWERDFSFKLPFDSQANLLDIQDQLIADINEQLVQYIFDEAFSGW